VSSDRATQVIAGKRLTCAGDYMAAEAAQKALAAAAATYVDTLAGRTLPGTRSGLLAALATSSPVPCSAQPLVVPVGWLNATRHLCGRMQLGAALQC
jgi:hypothetical protein